MPLLEMLEGLISTCSEIENTENPIGPFKKLRPAVEKFFTQLEDHSEREEDVLFTMMEAYIGRTSGPIAVMEYEHEQAKSLIGRFLATSPESEASLTAEKMKNESQLIKNAYYTLTDHFAKEENILFPMAEKMLSAEEKEELKVKINKI